MEQKEQVKLKLREKTMAYLAAHPAQPLWLPIVLSVVLLAALLVCSTFEQKKAKAYAPDGQAHVQADDDVATITFAGDIILGRNVEKRASNIGYDKLLSQVQDLWEKSDHVFANLDTCVIEGNVKDYEENGSKDVYFSTDKSNIRYLREAGIDALSIATDHIADYGRPTIKTAMDALDENGIVHTGAGINREEASQYIMLETKLTDGSTINVAVFGTLEYQADAYGAKAGSRVDDQMTHNFEIENYFDLVDTEESDVTASSDTTEVYVPSDPWAETAGTFSGKNPILLENIALARQEGADVIVIYIHWGDDSMFYPDDNMRKWAEYYIDAGADMVIGTNPRVLLPIETYKRGIICYSIGCLLYDDAQSRICDSMMLDFVVDSTLNRKVEITPMRINSCIPAETTNKFYTNRIFRTLTRNLEEGTYTLENNKLVIELGQKRPKA